MVVPASSFNPLIPQATDQISVSQGQLLLNFGALQTWIDVNHVDYASPDAGKHKFVTLTDQTGVTPTFAANEGGIFDNNFPQTSTREIWFNMPATGFKYPVTNCILSTNGSPGLASNGWQYGAGGTLEKWGTYTAGASGLILINIASAGAGGFGPGFTVTPWNCLITAYQGSTIYNPPNAIYVANITSVLLSIQSPGGKFMWRVIGA